MGQRRQDHYAREAQGKGFPARSVFKLEEMNRKHALFRPGMRVLDLGAAPGSWSMYVMRLVGAGGSVVAVDLQDLQVPVGPADRFTFIRGDFTEDAIADDLASRGPFSAVVSDAAPSTTGTRSLDTARSAALVESILYRLPQWLEPGGLVICKLFQGGEEQQLLAAVRKAFVAGRMFRPPAVRKESFEVYLVGTGYRGAGQ